MAERNISCEKCGIRAKNTAIGKNMANFPSDFTRCRQCVKVVGKENVLNIPVEKQQSKYIREDHFEKSKVNSKIFKGPPSKNLINKPTPDEKLKSFPLGSKENSMHKPKEISSENGNTADQIIKKMTKVNLTEGCEVEIGEFNNNESKLEPSSSKNETMLNNMTTEKPIRCGINHPKKLCNKYSQILRHQRKMRDLKSGMLSVTSFSLKTLIQMYLHSRFRKSNGIRWSSLDKMGALNILFKSSEVYFQIQRKIHLPSKEILESFLVGPDLRPGVIHDAIKQLKERRSDMFFVDDKMCALVFAKMDLKKELAYSRRYDLIEGYVDLGETRTPEIATHALVFMLQGLNARWNQVVAYYFVGESLSADSLAKIIKSVIIAVRKTGYTIVTTVCDHSPKNIASLNLLKQWSGTPKESHYFKHKNAKINIVFDVPRLFKAISNNFRSSGEIEIAGKKAKWSHLSELDVRNKKCLKLCKIARLNLASKKPQDLETAIKLLSGSVATSLKLLTHGCKEKKKEELIESVKVIEDFDRLFDCTNGPKNTKEIIEGKRQYVTVKTDHIKQWKGYKEKIKNVRFLKSGSSLELENPRCIQGYITTLSSLEDIWKVLHSKGVIYLDLRLLNQDNLEDYFKKIKRRNFSRENPSCRQFTRILKSMLFPHLGFGDDTSEDSDFDGLF